MNKEKKKWYKTWWGIILIILMFFMIIGFISPNDEPKKDSTNQNKEVQVEDLENKSAEEILNLYLQYYNYNGLNEAITNLETRKIYVTENFKPYLENDIIFFNKVSGFYQEMISYCKNSYMGENFCLGISNEFESIMKEYVRNAKIDSKEIKEKNESEVKIKVHIVGVYEQRNYSEKINHYIIYILIKDKVWKIDSVINENFPEQNLTIIQKENERIFQVYEEMVKEFKKTIDSQSALLKSKEYLSYSLSQTYAKFYESRLTELQQKQLWESELKGEKVSWEVYVKDISDGFTDEYQILGTIKRPTEYTIGSDVGISVKDSEKSKLANFYKGDIIKFEGILSDYGNIMGSKIFYVKEATILGKKEASQPTNMPNAYGDYSTQNVYCEIFISQCSTYGECDEINQMRNDGLC